MREMANWVMSIPIHRLSSFWAAATVVPHPQKGSRTTSPSLLLAWMIRSRRATGFWVGYPSRSAACASYGFDVRPQVLQGHSWHLVQVAFVIGHAALVSKQVFLQEKTSRMSLFRVFPIAPFVWGDAFVLPAWNRASPLVRQDQLATPCHQPGAGLSTRRTYRHQAWLR